MLFEYDENKNITTIEKIKIEKENVTKEYTILFLFDGKNQNYKITSYKKEIFEIDYLNRKKIKSSYEIKNPFETNIDKIILEEINKSDAFFKLKEQFKKDKLFLRDIKNKIKDLKTDNKKIIDEVKTNSPLLFKLSNSIIEIFIIRENTRKFIISFYRIDGNEIKLYNLQKKIKKNDIYEIDQLRLKKLFKVGK